jgi:serine/threonine-protein kinase ATR
MVGYIVGLGDRHGENILFDSTTGECLHVDFNCLFNKGETFETPERVPFRLTRNMVEAFGATKHEGVFRRSCEVTLQVLRSERDALTNVLTTFVHDPLLEWSSPKNKMRPPGASTEIVNETAMATIRNIENRLKGIDKKHKGPSLSVEGQVEKLINEATSLDNLSAMYIGWAPYL